MLSDLLKIIRGQDRDQSSFAAGLIESNRDSNVHSEGFQSADELIKINKDTCFHAASIAKPFISYLIHDLHISGSINIDNLVTKYYKCPYAELENTTIRHLLDHRSGLHDFWPYSYLAGHRSGDIVESEQIRRILGGVRSLNFEPGKAFSYCNSGYLILADLISDFHGMSISVIAAEKIFKPLGMASTFFVEDWRAERPRGAIAWQSWPGKPNREYTARYAVPGPTSLQTTVPDLLNFSRHLLDDEDPVVRNMLLDRPSYSYPSGMSYANGLFRYSKDDDIIGHSGMDWGFTSSWAVSLRAKSAVAVLSNNTNALAESAAAKYFTKRQGRQIPATNSKLGLDSSLLSNIKDKNLVFTDQYRQLHMNFLNREIFLPTSKATLSYNDNSGLFEFSSGMGFAYFDVVRDILRINVITNFDHFCGELDNSAYFDLENEPLPDVLTIEHTNLSLRVAGQSNSRIELKFADMETMTFERFGQRSFVGPGYDLVLDAGRVGGRYGYLSQPRCRKIALF